MNNYHGRSVRIFFTKKKSNYSLYKKLPLVLSNESKIKLYNVKTYKLFQKNIEKYKKKFQSKIRKISYKSTIIAVGASAKGNTFKLRGIKL